MQVSTLQRASLGTCYERFSQAQTAKKNNNNKIKYY